MLCGVCSWGNLLLCILCNLLCAVQVSVQLRKPLIRVNMHIVPRALDNVAAVCCAVCAVEETSYGVHNIVHWLCFVLCCAGVQ